MTWEIELRNRSCTLRGPVLKCADQREEVVQHMPENSHGTLEVVGR
jgi:hypothetical protein